MRIKNLMPNVLTVSLPIIVTLTYYYLITSLGYETPTLKNKIVFVLICFTGSTMVAVGTFQSSQYCEPTSQYYRFYSFRTSEGLLMQSLIFVGIFIAASSAIFLPMDFSEANWIWILNTYCILLGLVLLAFGWHWWCYKQPPSPE